MPSIGEMMELSHAKPRHMFGEVFIVVIIKEKEIVEVVIMNYYHRSYISDTTGNVFKKITTALVRWFLC